MQEAELTYIEGTVDAVIYQNRENGYTVLRLDAGEGRGLTVVGCLPGVAPGESISVQGTWMHHASYGEQFKAEAVERRMPAGTKAIFDYLASGAVRGIGAATARRMVEEFGEEALTVLEEHPERLTQIKGITRKRALAMGEHFRQQMGMRRLLEFLGEHEVPLQLAMPLYRKYGDRALEIIRGNPYLLVDRELGVDFSNADALALSMGMEGDDPQRLEAGLLFELTHNLDNGHTFLPRRKLLPATAQLIGVGEEALEEALEALLERGEVVEEPVAGEQAVYLHDLCEAEQYVAFRLWELAAGEIVAPHGLEELIDRIQAEQGITYAPQQRQAVELAATSQVMLLTGGPGTGKTTAVGGIIALYEKMGLNFALVAPTGRAAKRITELTGYEAKTIHRLLELTGAPTVDQKNNGNSGENRLEGMHFERNEDNPLEADVIIIDEMSMVDINLMHSLLRAVNVGTRLILVGDVDQLPSVGPGNVLRDIIESECFHVVKLTRIFRQAAQSDIIVNAHRINAGERIPIGKSSRDFLFIKRDDPNAIINAMITLVREKLPNYVHADLFEVQVMTPMRKGVLGSIRLNSILQEFLNPPSAEKAEKEYGETTFRVGDKVMQIKNNYQIEWTSYNRSGIPVDKGAGVFNGDLGRIREINTFAELVTVEYDEGKRVEYSFKQLEELELAYAITIHKSQGSEYPAVVIPVWSGPQMLMTRNLIYTAVTRARACVCLVGVPYVFQQMVDNAMEQKRYSGLRDRIEEIMETL